ncbi:hypothetical protein [Candidatus Korobacter versatilis]|uniref:hypothetical protein n=1 Tax=Candidatus Korobacter versatilis TaxID=658062 RepID=UPI0005A41F0C|nr:hypothetical protein [Candidatus Koribacter versatilis]
MKKTHGLVVLIVCGVLLQCSCRVHTVPADGGFVTVFEGFVYVGMDVNRNSHSNYGEDAPVQFFADHSYVFHHRVPFDDVEFARTDLPLKLQRLGFSVTSPVNDVAVVDPGGELWGVKFARADCSGVIYSRPCPSLIKRSFPKDRRWGESEFVLELHGACTN